MEICVRHFAAIALVVLSSSAKAQQYNPIVFNQASELIPWCKAEAEARYIEKGVTPYQWTARYYERSNVLYVEGKLRANDKDVPVNCRVARGAREQYATIEIEDSTL